VIDKIKGEASVEFEKMFPEKQPSKVKIILKDGRVFEKQLDYPKGDPREPMTDEDLDNKFDALAGGLLTEHRRKEIKVAIYSCESMDAKEFMSRLVI
jgi:2-methylcitrate dehydratase